MRHTLKWFTNRIGKRVYCKPLHCGCRDCQKTYVDIGIFHPTYLKACQDEMGKEYFDRPLTKEKV